MTCADSHDTTEKAINKQNLQESINNTKTDWVKWREDAAHKYENNKDTVNSNFHVYRMHHKSIQIHTQSIITCLYKNGKMASVLHDMIPMAITKIQ